MLIEFFLHRQLMHKTRVMIQSKDLVWFYGISTIERYLMPNPLYIYISNIYDSWHSLPNPVYPNIFDIYDL